jgi:hypothetical protein
MHDLPYYSFTIKIKQFQIGKDSEWLATVRDSRNKTLASNWLPSYNRAELWAKDLIDNLQMQCKQRRTSRR